MPINVLTENDFSAKSFTAAQKAFARKAALTSDQFEKLAADHRRRAFRIAGVNNARLVQRSRNLTEKAIRDGRPFVEFRAELLKLFTRAGLNPPALHRLQLLYRQNVLASYSDARRATLDKPEIASAFPFRMYLTVGNGTPGVRNVREDHAVLHRKVFAWDDPFWDRFTPPWDYGCRCTFIAIRPNQVKKARMTVWTFRGGRVTPTAGVGRATAGGGRATRKGPKPFRLQPNPGFSSRRDESFDLSKLDADLRKLLEESLK